MLKKPLRGVLRRLGFDVVRHCEMPVRPFNVLRLVVDDLLRSGREIDFVQIGANDGELDDPLHVLVKKNKLSGLLVEPVPDLFTRLKANYAGLPGLKYECCAVAASDGVATLYRVRPDAPLPNWVHGLASFDRSHLSEVNFPTVKGLERYVVPIDVPTLTIRSLFAKHAIHEPSLLQIDTEGFDCEIVRMTLHEGIRPLVIHYEFLNVPPSERRRCKDLLISNGYYFVDTARDTLALREDCV